MYYVWKFLWVVCFAAALFGINWLANKNYFDKARASYKGTEYTFSRDNWNVYFRIFSVVVLVLVLFLAGCSSSSPPSVAVVASVNCQGSYVGSYGPPEHDERIRLRNLSLGNRGIAVTGNADIDNANAGGGAPDGGIWMGGSYAFETDANCNVTTGKTLIFYAYEYSIGGTVGKDGVFNLTWQGQGSAGDMKGKVDATGNITGQFFHPAPDNFVYGVLSGTFTPVAVK